ncbi:MAG: UbiA-like polyprenyltransferase [Phycisphaerae bacterium]
MTSLYDSAKTWAEMIKLSHSVFALPFALLATFLAASPALPQVGQFALIVICMVAARSAAMTFNRIVDADVDAANPRTSTRPIPRGKIGMRAAWAFLAVSGAIFGLGAAGFWIGYRNPWPLWLSAPVLAWLCGYSYTKRFTAWSHVVLGAGIALAPVAAWISISPRTLGPPAWLLMLTVTTWIAGFDLIYACQDAGFDRSAGLFSVPARFGVATALWLARGLHVVTVLALVGVGWTSGLGAIYYVGVASVAALLTIENAIVSPRDLTRVNLAFFTLNGVVGVLLGALGILDVVLRNQGMKA